MEKAERAARDAELDKMREVRALSWEVEQKCVEYEERIGALEALLEEERAAHAVLLQRNAEASEQALQEQHLQLLEVMRQCDEAVAAANARARAAEDEAELARQQAEQQIRSVRIQEEARVAEIRAAVSARVRECEQQLQQHLDLASRSSLQRQHAMEETLFVHGRERCDVLFRAERRIASMQEEVEAFKAAQEAELASKETQLESLKAVQERHLKEVRAQHQEILDLEREAANRIMERAVERVTRQLLAGLPEGASPEPVTAT